jgi:hypothetical protein
MNLPLGLQAQRSCELITPNILPIVKVVVLVYAEILATQLYQV